MKITKASSHRNKVPHAAPASHTRRFSTKAVVKLLVGLILIAVILYFVDWRRTLDVLTTTDAAAALLAVLILSLNIFISTSKWDVLLRSHGLVVSWYELLRAYWVGSFFSNYLPSNVGGDVVRLVMLQRLGRSAEVAASIVLERVTGLAILLALSAIGLALRPAYFAAGGLLFVLWLAVGGGMALLAVLIVLSRSLNGWLLSTRADEGGAVHRFLARIGKLSTAIEHYRGHKGAVAANLLLSIPFYMVLIAFQFLILRAIDADVPLLDVLAIAPIISLVSLIPVTLNGLGVAEAAFVLFYAQAGVLPEQALAAAALRRLFSLLVSLVGGAFWIAGRPRPA